MALSDKDESLRIEAAYIVEDILKDVSAHQRIRSYVLATTNDSLPDIGEVQRIHSRQPLFVQFVTDMVSSQKDIQDLGVSLDMALNDIPIGPIIAPPFKAWAVGRGVFASLVDAASGRPAIDAFVQVEIGDCVEPGNWPRIIKTWIDHNSRLG